MKTIILIFNVVIFFSCNAIDKHYFEVIEGQRSLFQKDNDSTKIYHRISLKGNQDLLLYPINIKAYSQEEKLQMIKELLTFKGDNRICSNPITNYKPELSQIYKGESENYSIQLEALFLINQIFFENPFNYSPMPVLIDDKTKKEETIKGDIIEMAYLNYEKWLKKVEEMGIEKALKNKIYPLNNSNLSWRYGIE
ncbi:MAG: hypothetical protein KAH72_00820 [Flavobacteriaceae bacterium]|nr:hypothetical protein [Flavobacteriaceae bacterium]